MLELYLATECFTLLAMFWMFCFMKRSWMFPQSKYCSMKKADISCEPRSVDRLYCEVKRWIDESGTKIQCSSTRKGENWESKLLFCVLFHVIFCRKRSIQEHLRLLDSAINTVYVET